MLEHEKHSEEQLLEVDPVDDVLDDSDQLNNHPANIQDEMNNQLAELIIEKLLNDERISTLFSEARKQGQRPRNRLSDRRDFNQPKCFSDLIMNAGKPPALPKELQFAHDYLNALKVTNRELYEDFREEGFPSKKRSADFDWSFNVEELLIIHPSKLDLLYRIENFMLLLVLKPLPAFIEDQGTSRQGDIAKKITSIGKEFLFLISRSNEIIKFDHEYLTAAVKIYVEFTDKQLNSLQRNMAFHMGQDISWTGVSELNKLLFELRELWVKGKYNLSPLVGNSRGWYSSRVDTEYRSFAKFKEKLKARVKRADRDRELLAKYKNSDVAVCRFQIELFCDEESVRHDFFKNFFTEFIKKLKEEKNDLAGLLSFIGMWKEMQGGVLQNDVALFFDANKLSASKDYSNLFGGLEGALQNFAEKILEKEIEALENEKKKDWKVDVSQIPVLLDVSSERIWLLEARSSLWKNVDQKLIPYFYLMDSYEREYTDAILSRVSSSRK